MPRSRSRAASPQPPSGESRREMLAEDVQDVIRYRESWAAIDVAPDATATEADIHDYLIERREDRRAEAAT
ncbi:MAG: hypothetical protein EBR82_72260 [Caulobacteraceae bacterium]|nr:hypothetical protein [Caulobacteraceae bacterium]